MQVAQNVPTIVLKIQQSFFKFLSFFSRSGVIKGLKNWGLGILDSQTKISKLMKNFSRKFTRKTGKKIQSFFFEFLLNFDLKKALKYQNKLTLPMFN